MYRTTYSNGQTHAELRSRIVHHHQHYIPDIFEKKLGMSVYNSGTGRKSIFFNFAFLKCNYPYRPKAVILGFNVTEFKFREIIMIGYRACCLIIQNTLKFAQLFP